MIIQVCDDHAQDNDLQKGKPQNDYISVSTFISSATAQIRENAIAVLELSFPEMENLVEGRLGSFQFYILGSDIIPTFIYPYGIGIEGVRHQVTFRKKSWREHLFHKGIASAIECLILGYCISKKNIDLDTFMVQHDVGLGSMSPLRDQQLELMGVKSNRTRLRYYLTSLSPALGSDFFKVIKPMDYAETLQLSEKR